MLAKLARTLPEGDGWCFEPKWDGFRCLAFVDGDAVDLRSRHDRPFARYFPEIATALGQLQRRIVLDGELIVVTDRGFDFDALMRRLHPAASRAASLAHETPACFVAFDVLAVDDGDVTGEPFTRRRSRLDTEMGRATSPLRLTPITSSPDEAAAWLTRYQGGGIDGVVAKRADMTYQSGVRAMVKVKPERTADCVVAGFRLFAEQPVVGSLLLGLYDGEGHLGHVGVATSFTRARRAALIHELREYAAPLAGHPWEHGFALEGGSMGRLKGAAGRWTPDMTMDWVPLHPVLVAEVAYDQVDGRRFRHPARFRRWRPDRDPTSCRYDQLAFGSPPHLPLGDSR